MSIIADWTPDKAKAFTRDNLVFQHGLHERPMFDDAGLEQLLDRYPREKLGVFTMGEDPVAWTTWRKGSAGASPHTPRVAPGAASEVSQNTSGS